MTASSAILLAIVLAPLLGALLIVAVALRAPRAAQSISVISCLVSLAGALLAVEACENGGTLGYAYGGWIAPFGIAARVDGIGAVLVALIAGVATLTLIFAERSLQSELPRDRSGFYAMALLLVAALQGMATTADLFNLYVFLEISSLAAYALIGVGGGPASLASFRYLIIGTVGASFYLLGVAYIFALTGSLNGPDIALALGGLPDSTALLVGLAFLAVGLGLKMAVFPLHGWLPDAYSYAPSTASALIGGLMTKVSALALLRVLYVVFAPGKHELLPPVTDLLGFLGAIGIVVGSLMAVAQRDFKRMLAYSSIAHLGFIAVGISLGNASGISGAVFHMVAHGVAKATLFLIAGGVVYRLGALGVDGLAGLHRIMPISTFALVVAALSMIGIPPTAGFFSKWYLMLGCLEAGRGDLFAVIVGSTVLSAWYFLRLFETIFFTQPDDVRSREELPGSMLAPIAIGSAATILLGIANQYPLETLIAKAPVLSRLVEVASR